MTVGTTRRRLLIALAFLLPNLLGFLAFTAGPLFGSLWMSFTDLQLTQHNAYSDVPVQFVGLDNYREVLVGAESERFWKYLGNSLYLMIGIPVSIAGSLGLALLITAKFPPTGTNRRVVLSVIVTAATLVAAGAVWWLLRPDAAMRSQPSAVSADLSAYDVQRLRAIAGALAVLTIGGLAVFGVAVGSLFFRTAFYLPSLLAGVPMFLLWKTLYRPDGGLVNALVSPIADGVYTAVAATPGFLWTGLAVLLWAATTGLAARAVAVGIVRVRDRDVALAGFLARLTLAATLSLVGLWLGLVIFELPGRVEAAAGFDAPEWLVSSTWAKPALVIMGVWLGVGGANMLLYIAGLSNVPPELYEAASIDGASGWARFANVTWPQLAPTTFFIVIMSTIGGLQGGFEQALIMTGGLYDTTVLTYYIYNLAFTDRFQLGMASAVAWVMFAMIFAMTLINYRFGSRMTNE